MKNGTLTYGQLYDRLETLGFRRHPVEIDSKSGQVFEHPKIAHSLIVLPERDRKDLVEPLYLGSVSAKLKAFDLLRETNPLLT